MLKLTIVLNPRIVPLRFTGISLVLSISVDLGVLQFKSNVVRAKITLFH